MGLRSHVLHRAAMEWEDTTTDGCREKPSEIQEPIQGAERCLQEQRLWLRNLFTFLCVFHTKTFIHHQSGFSSTSPLLGPSPLPPMSSRHRRVAEGTQPRGGSLLGPSPASPHEQQAQEGGWGDPAKGGLLPPPAPPAAFPGWHWGRFSRSRGAGCRERMAFSSITLHIPIP